jgi:uncharacterized repeat protein (TIGR01451 family)
MGLILGLLATQASLTVPPAQAAGPWYVFKLTSKWEGKMKRFDIAHFQYLLLVAFIPITLGLLLIVPGTTQIFAQGPQTTPLIDAHNNVVRDGEQRFNYLAEQGGGFARVEVNGQGQVISRQSLAESPFGTIAVEPMIASSDLLTSQAGGSNPSLLKPEWKYGVYGSGIGLSHISVFDIDGDNTLEMIMGGSSGGGFGADDFWYVVKRTGTNTYDQVWLSDLYSATINRIAVADVNANGIGEIYVGLADGRVYIYDGLSKAEIGSFTAGGPINALVIANADGDSSQEIVISDGSKIYVYSALSFTLEWASAAYGGTDLAVGNVDADAAPEIVTTSNSGHGYVLDGVSHALEWDYISSFGNIVELGNIDGDSMLEIIGAASWYKITAFDADIKTPKWEIPADLDIGALLVANTDGVGAPEILYGDGQWGAIHCYDSVTRTERWFINNPEHGVTDIAIGDVNNDSVLEVVWGAGATSSGADHLYVGDTVTRLIEWQNIDITGPLSAVDVGNVDSDAQNEIVMVSYRSNSGYDDGVIHIFNAATHALEWRSTDLPNISTWTGVKSVKIGNVDSDSQTEFVIATADLYDGLIQIYNGQTHTFERQSAKYNGASFTALAIGDVDSDGKTEIVVGQKREHTGATGVYLIVFDGATAAEEWKSVGLDTYWGQVYDIELANVDNDSNIEIIASVAGERIYVYDGVTHQLDWLAAIPAYALEVANVDADSQQEILIGKNNGVVDVYSGSTFTLENSFTLGTGPITGLLVDDIDQDGKNEWVVSESTKLSVFNGATKELIWQRSDLGNSLGNFNHLNSGNVDNDSNKELVLGSSFALYQFDVIQASSLSPSTKTVAPTTASPGDPLNYTITLNNGGAANLTNVQVTDSLPSYLTYINNSLSATGGSYGFNNGVISWNGTINAGQVITVTFAATITDTTPPGAVITNTATISQGGSAFERSAVTTIGGGAPGAGVVYLPIILRSCPIQFTDDFSNPGSGWPVANTGNALFEYLNGEYHILVKNANWWFVAGPGVKVSNYTVTVDVRNATGTDGSYGLVFGGADDVSQFYTFEIFPDSSYEIYRYNSGWTFLTGGASASINPGTATNRLTIERSGSQIKAYANGQLLSTLTDGTFTGPRHVGLITSSYNQPNVDARFDNFSVCGSWAANTLSSEGETLSVAEEGTEGTASGYMTGDSNRQRR